MKNRFLILLLASCVLSACVFRCQNAVAVLNFENDLNEIEQLLSNPNYNQKNMPEIINRLEKVTMLQSESDGNFLGKFNPTSKDIQRWTDWFKLNKHLLCWNKRKQMYYIKRD